MRFARVAFELVSSEIVLWAEDSWDVRFWTSAVRDAAMGLLVYSQLFQIRCPLVIDSHIPRKQNT